MKKITRSIWFWCLIGALFFIPLLGGLHLFDWDEINFAEIAREMVVTGDWLKMQINYEVFTEKPPLFFWIQASSMSLFGVGEFAARFPNALLGAIVLPYLFWLGKKLLDARFGFLWALSWFGSILPFLYFKSGLIDPLFNFFIFNGLLHLILASWKRRGISSPWKLSKTQMLWIGGAFIGLAILTKGPVAYLLIFLTFGVMTILAKALPVKAFDFIKFSVSALVIFGLWFAVDLLIRGPEFIVEFTIRQWELLTTGDAGHSGFFGYHFVVLLLGCFPASLFAIPALRKSSGLPENVKSFRLWMVVLFWVVLLLFSLVGTKIIHYSSMAYYPLTFLSALTLWKWLGQKNTLRIVSNGVVGVGILICIISAALPYLGMNKDLLMPLLEADPFAVKNMEANVLWWPTDFIPALWMGIALVFYIYFRKRNRERALYFLFGGTAIWVMLGLIFFSGKIERISQRANLSFFEEQVGQPVYVTTYGYKSYAPWFYARIEPHKNDSAVYSSWLLKGNIDQTVRISVKINRKDQFESEIPDAVYLYEENGFYFYERPALSK